MTDTLTITVTQEDIDKGTKGHCSKCPIALAALRAFPGSKYVSVTGDIEMTFESGRYEYWSIDDLAVSFMDTFDHGYAVTPFSFTAMRMEDY